MLNLEFELIAILILVAVIGILMGRFLCKNGENEEREKKEKIIHAYKALKNEFDISQDKIQEQLLSLKELENHLALAKQEIENSNARLKSSDVQRDKLLSELKNLEKYKPKFESLDREFKLQSKIVEGLKNEKIANQKEIADFKIISNRLNKTISDFKVKEGEWEREKINLNKTITEQGVMYKKSSVDSEQKIKEIVRSKEKEYEDILQKTHKKYQSKLESKTRMYEKLEEESIAKYRELVQEKDKAYEKLEQESKSKYKEMIESKNKAYEKLEQENKIKYKEMIVSKNKAYEKLEQESKIKYKEMIVSKNKAYEKLEQESKIKYKEMIESKDKAYEMLEKSTHIKYKNSVQSKDKAFEKLQQESDKRYQNMVHLKDEAYESLEKERTKAYDELKIELEKVEREYEEFKINYNLDSDRLDLLESDHEKIYHTLETIVSERDDLLARLRAISSVVGAVGVDNGSSSEKNQQLLENR